MRALKLIIVLILLIPIKSFACDTTPTITITNILDLGGNFLFDIEVCIGESGSESGFTTSLSGGLNIISFSPATLTGNNTATGSITGGVLDYNYAGGGPAPANMFVDPGIFQPCFFYTVMVDGDPNGETLTLDGVNSLYAFSCASLTTAATIVIGGGGGGGGGCSADYTVTGPGSFTGNTTGGLDDCWGNFGDDHQIEVIIPCDDNWTFSTCNAATNFDTWLLLGNVCCGSSIIQNDQFCGNQSQFTTFLMAGTYWITIEGWLGLTGDYQLDIFSDLSCIVLPVELLEFDVSCDKLLWSTASEINNDYFTIEYSSDGYNWVPYTIIAGNGNKNTISNYELNATNLKKGYYSLSQTDYNGSHENLGIVHISCDTYQKTPLRYYNAMGQLVPEYTLGVVFIQYADGSTTAYNFINKEQWDSKR